MFFFLSYNESFALDHIFTLYTEPDSIFQYLSNFIVSQNNIIISTLCLRLNADYGAIIFIEINTREIYS